MKIALTADCHLTKIEDHPERYQAFESILKQLVEREIETLVVAGDLFDKGMTNYADFDKICHKKKYQKIQIFILPGNHDPDLESGHFTSKNVHVISEPKFLDSVLDETPILAIPYRADMTMGEGIEPFHAHLQARRWILVGHGDYTSGLRIKNPYEQGVYMPLTGQDVERTQPLRCFLGHIHILAGIDRVHYPGSPCGMDINEIGLRYFLVYDSDLDEIEPVMVDTPVVYFNERLLILPVEDEKTYIEEQIKSRIEAWGLPAGWEDRVRVRVRVAGYCQDIRALEENIRKGFSAYAFNSDEDPDVSGVNLADDLERQHIAQQVRDRLADLDWPAGEDEPDRDQIMLAALQAIYGGE
jgi:DNA repair exonuclease SbcCD nuclease subunit